MIRVDDRVLKRRLKRLGSAAERVLQRAKRDAARQVRTQAKREIAKQLKLPVRDVAQPIVANLTGKQVSVHIRYRRVAAHRFRGWRYTQISGGQVRRETATGKRASSRQTRRSVAGLRIQFQKTRPAIVFPAAFRQSSVGRGRVFLQRVGKSRYPLEAISGPPVHSKALEQLPDYTAHGQAALQRRLEYWVNREANRT